MPVKNRTRKGSKAGRTQERHGIVVTALSHRGRVRKRNEDAFLIDQASREHARRGIWQLVGVADGLGGHPAGDVASELVLDTMETRLADLPGMIDSLEEGWLDALERRLLEAVSRANRELLEHVRRNPEREGMATTLVTAVFPRGWLGVAHVGDSRAYLLRGGRAHPLTSDHTWEAEQLARGILDPGQIERSPLCGSVTRVLGRSAVERADLAWVALAPGDVVVLASDGLTRYLDGAEILAIVEEASDLKAAIDRLVERALDDGGRDNITVLLARYDGLAGRPLRADRARIEAPSQSTGTPGAPGRDGS